MLNIGESKLYIFMTSSISRVGGAEIYVSSKTRWLERGGWTVLIAAPLSDDCPVSYGNAILVDFRYYSLRPACLPKTLRYKAIGPLIDAAQGYSEVAIESSTITCGMWGEVVSRQINSRHLIFHLGETVPPLSYGDRVFLRHKNDAGELAFISAEVGKIALRGVDGEYPQCSILVAYQGEVIQQVPYEGLSRFEDGIRIGCVSRLDKSYIPLVADGVARLAERRKETRFQLVFIGDAPDPSIKKCLEAKSSDNLSIIVRGPMYPLPRALVESFDVFVAKAGSAIALRRQGFPTIQFALEKDICIGIAGIDFSNSACAAARDLTVVLSNFLFGERYRSCDPGYGLSPVESVDYSDHFAYIFQSKTSCSFDQVSSGEESFRERIKGVLASILGLDRYVAMRSRLKLKLRKG